MGWTPISKAVTVVANPKCCVRRRLQSRKSGAPVENVSKFKTFSALQA